MLHQHHHSYAAGIPDVAGLISLFSQTELRMYVPDRSAFVSPHWSGGSAPPPFFQTIDAAAAWIGALLPPSDATNEAVIFVYPGLYPPATMALTKEASNIIRKLFVNGHHDMTSTKDLIVNPKLGNASPKQGRPLDASVARLPAEPLIAWLTRIGVIEKDKKSSAASGSNFTYAPQIIMPANVDICGVGPWGTATLLYSLLISGERSSITNIQFLGGEILLTVPLPLPTGGTFILTQCNFAPGATLRLSSPLAFGNVITMQCVFNGDGTGTDPTVLAVNVTDGGRIEFDQTSFYQAANMQIATSDQQLDISFVGSRVTQFANILFNSSLNAPTRTISFDNRIVEVNNFEISGRSCLVQMLNCLFTGTFANDALAPGQITLFDSITQNLGLGSSPFNRNVQHYTFTYTPTSSNQYSRRFGFPTPYFGTPTSIVYGALVQSDLSGPINVIASSLNFYGVTFTSTSTSNYFDGINTVTIGMTILQDNTWSGI